MARRLHSLVEVLNFTGMPNPVLKLGSKSKDVETLQRLLNGAGATPALTPDGHFGAKTEAALGLFQKAQGLPVSGIADTATWAALLPTAQVNIADPGEPELLSPEDFEASMLDRREEHSPLVKSGKKMIPYTPRVRAWSRVRGVTLHQTACDMGERIARYDTCGAHFAVLRSGRVIWLADLDRVIYHGNGWNEECVGIEINGLYAGLEDDPDTALDESLRTTWDDPTTPTRETPMQVTPAAMRATRQLIRWIKWKVAQNGGALSVLNAHRQSSVDRRNDPGEAIWKQVALPLHTELALTDGGVGFKIGGYAIPQEWDPRCKNLRY